MDWIVAIHDLWTLEAAGLGQSMRLQGGVVDHRPRTLGLVSTALAYNTGTDMAKNWRYAARLLWPVLTKAAEAKTTLTYSEIAPVAGTNARNVRRALGPIMHHCVDAQLPPLTAIVIGKTGGVPGEGFTSWAIDDIGTAQQAVYHYDWNLVINPFAGFDEADTIESLSRRIMRDPARSEEVYAKIGIRGPIQAIFRAALLRTYGERCAICGLGFKEALDAAHIIPWSKATPSQRISPRNGLLLCSNHHRLFDSGRITISEEFLVLHDSQAWKTKTYAEADEAASTKLHGTRLRLPSNRNLRPKRSYLRRRIGAN